MMQSELFQERIKRDIGMKKAASNHKNELEEARNVAIQIARHKGQVSIEDVRHAFLMRGTPIQSGNWMGSVFRGKQWVSVGFELCRHADGHGRAIRIWRLRDEFV